MSFDPRDPEQRPPCQKLWMMATYDFDQINNTLAHESSKPPCDVQAPHIHCGVCGSVFGNALEAGEARRAFGKHYASDHPAEHGRYLRP